MQFHRGDVSQCFGAVDGTYFSHEVGIKYFRIAIKNYTFPILLNKVSQRKSSVTKFIARHSPCKTKQSFEQFPYTVANDTMFVTPVVEGQLLEPTNLKDALPQQFEFGIIKGTRYRVCYPSDIVVDYFVG